MYDDVITAQPSSNDFTDITNTVNQNHGKHDHSHESLSSGMTQSNTYNGKRFSLYIGQLTWVSFQNKKVMLKLQFVLFIHVCLVDNRR